MSKNNLLSFLLVLFVMISTSEVFGQGVTTGNIAGFVKDASGEALPGATVIAVHTPTGTKYGNVTNLNGRYVITNVKVGGPYEITVTYVGYTDNVRNNVYVSLGSTADADFELKEEGIELTGVTVTAERDALINTDKTGASTNLSVEQINELPTISRSIDDFTRLTPQSNGTSFAGRDNRFNNYTVDGNIYNNNFGLGSGQFAGSNPISLDAIEEVQVNLAPFDVRQGGFTGANVNAITRSGTNKFDVSVYSYFRNDQLIGDKVGDDRITIQDSENTIRGFRIGGPIIKNKLFFFINYEEEEEAVPSFNKVAARDGLTPDGLTVSRILASDLDFVREQLSNIYGYETGDYENYSFASEGKRFNVRLDYNINANHKVAVRYNSYVAFRDVPTNGNSIRFIRTRYRNTDRTGIEAMNFRNTNYTEDNNITSVMGELTSRFGNNVSNQLNIGYTSITNPKRGIPGGQAFPFIEVLEPDASGNPLYAFSVGNELFSVGNLLENKVLNITNSTTYFMGKHTLTGGVNFESMTFDNAFNPVFNGFYRFASYNDFVEAVINKNPNVYPAAFANSFSFDGSSTPPTDQTRFSQLGLYVQDEYQANENLVITAGLRVDLPFYPIDLPRNENLDALDRTFTNPDGSTFKPDVSAFPKVRPLWSPRISANWDVFGDQKLQVRGGTGIFSGRIPFVWLSNQVNGSGVIRGGQGFEGQAVIDNNILFNPDVNAYKPNPEDLDATLTSELNLTDPNFKLPQVWRTNIAADYVLPGGIVATVEGIYTKDVSTPIALNPVLREPDGVLAGSDPRPYWNGSYSNDEKFTNVFQLTNADKQGDYYSITLQAQKRFDFGVNFMVAYTRSRARDYGLEGGSQAISLWSSVVSTDRNDPDISFTRFDVPHRVIGALSYNIGKTTTVSMFYQGSSTGRFSYTYSGDTRLTPTIFGDGAQRLMYVPNNASELTFEEFTAGGRTVTVQEQQEAFDAYIDNDEYLSSIRGQVSERNGARLPWVNRFDFRLLQDIPLGKHKLFGAEYQHKFQLTLDILNIGNLFNSAWGVQQTPVQQNLLSYRGRTDNNEPIYRLNFVSGTSEFPKEFSDSSTRNEVNLGQTWRAQIGIRYIFN